jgi:hypothetical protein
MDCGRSNRRPEERPAAALEFSGNQAIVRFPLSRIHAADGVA